MGVLMRRVLLAAMVLGLAACAPEPPPIASKAATQAPVVIFDTSSNCASQPSIDRMFSADPFVFDGVGYVAMNRGNEISIFRADTLAEVARSRFKVGNMGDSDYDLLNFSLCDDCSLGVANYKRATVRFRLAIVGGALKILDQVVDYDHALIPGSMTYSTGGDQYLITQARAGDGCQGSALYRWTGVDQLALVECVTVPGLVPQIVGGEHVGSALYLADKSTRVFLMRIDGEGLVHQSTPWTTFSTKGTGMDFDDGLAIVATTGGARVYDVSDPLAPGLLTTISGDFNRAAIGDGLVIVGKKGFAHSERTFDVTDPAAPVEIQAGFWSAGNAWNYPGSQCAEFQGAAIVDGRLWLARYSIAQVVDVSGWIAPPPPELIFADGFESGGPGPWQ